MPDLTPELLPELTTHRLPELGLGQGLVIPAYEGHSILNLPDSLCHLLDVPALQNRPLATPVLEALGGPYRRVVVLLVDALGLHRLQRWMGDGTAPIWAGLARDGLFAPLTSVVPSTTSTCLPCLWSGLSPQEHGMVGYELWLKEYGVVANMIKHSPFTIQHPAGSLEQAGFNPQQALPPPTLASHLARHGIPTLALQPYPIAKSGLSRMLLKDATIRPFNTPVDLWISAREILERRAGDPLYLWAYWGDLDYTGHNYGPDHPRSAAELAEFSNAFERHFLASLSPAARQDTLFILTADHGQITTPKDPFYDLKSHPNLARRLHLLPTGENRLIYLFIQPGQTAAVQEYLERTFLRQFIILDPSYAASQGLFGPGEPHPQLKDRTGDLMAIARNTAYLWWAEKENPIIGRHGGLSREEMLVPFLASPLS